MNRPEWLQPNKIIYSKQHGLIQISTILGSNLYFRKGSVSQIIFDWEKEIELGNLTPADVLSHKSIVYQEIATELEGRNKLAHCDIITEAIASCQPIPESVHEAVSQALFQLRISQLYSHQIEAWKAYEQGKDIIL